MGSAVPILEARFCFTQQLPGELRPVVLAPLASGGQVPHWAGLVALLMLSVSDHKALTVTPWGGAGSLCVACLEVPVIHPFQSQSKPNLIFSDVIFQGCHGYSLLSYTCYHFIIFYAKIISVLLITKGTPETIPACQFPLI